MRLLREERLRLHSSLPSRVGTVRTNVRGWQFEEILRLHAVHAEEFLVNPFQSFHR